MNNIVIFETGDQPVEVRLEGESLWVTQNQMAELFDVQKAAVSKHLKNIFASGELDPGATVSKMETVQKEGKRTVSRQVEHYNLDAIISVGYRVNSTRATRFRQWATRVLSEHLTQGYSLDARKLAERGLGEVQEALALMARTLQAHALVTDEGAAVLAVVRQYLGSFDLLLAYDENRLPDAPRAPVSAQVLTLDAAQAAIEGLRRELAARGETTELFGRKRGDGLAGILGAIEQTMFGEPLYPSAQSRAANLLYFVIKDHPFSDGNKRIGTLLFLDYLRRNDLLLRPDGQPRFAANAIVALALLIAESAPAQKDLMVRLTLALMEND